MSKRLFLRLKGKRDEVARDAAQRMLNGGGIADVQEELQRIAAYDAVLEAEPEHKLWRLSSAAVIGVLCVVIAIAGWLLRVPRTAIELDLQTKSVSFRLDHEWTGPGGRLTLDTTSDGLLFQEMDKLVLGREGLQIPDGNSIYIQGDRVSIAEITIGRHGVVDLEKDADDLLNLFVRGAPFDAVLGLEGNVRIEPEIRACEAPCPPMADQLLIHAEANVVPLRVRLHPGQRRVISNLVVDRLSFARVASGATDPAVFTSGIVGGMVTLADTSREVNLVREDVLSLEDVRGTVTELGLGDSIGVRFSGSTGSILVGPKTYERELMPSYLHYIYHSNPLSFFVGVVVFLWGMLWSVQRFLFS